MAACRFALEPKMPAERLVFDHVEQGGGKMKNPTALGIGMFAVVLLAGLAVLVAVAPRLTPGTVLAVSPDRAGALQTSTDANTGIVVSGLGTATAKPDV